MTSNSLGLASHQIRPLIPYTVQISHHSFIPTRFLPLYFPLKTPQNPSTSPLRPLIPKAQTTTSHRRRRRRPPPPKAQEEGIPVDLVKTLVQFKSRHNYIRVLEVSRTADHPFAGARLLLLDAPGNIHSISYVFKSLTNTYFDVFATLPPLLPPGPLGVLGFGAGSAARLILELYPEAVVHGWELDPSVISVARGYFGLSKFEKRYPDRLVIYIGNALEAVARDGFSGILVDLFSNGCLIPELQDPITWVNLKKSLRKDGRIMVNVGGSWEAEDLRRDGKVLMEETLKAIHQVFPGQVFVLNLGNWKDYNTIALIGEPPDFDEWAQFQQKAMQCQITHLHHCHSLLILQVHAVLSRVLHRWLGCRSDAGGMGQGIPVLS
ncbi:uncharacterized protein LOC131146800 isoform X2 [Malania oleifera]|uniref:uncharacterized protein LOC131146800 isoform X2 n=1 Tax=Malania oleifera TaxID=397392 RepID=UPI0025AEC8AD|nr:uncharacterized protein LOC131146800 isoform X2 [Malania oleifera]